VRLNVKSQKNVNICFEAGTLISAKRLPTHILQIMKNKKFMQNLRRLSSNTPYFRASHAFFSCAILVWSDLRYETDHCDFWI